MPFIQSILYKDPFSFLKQVVIDFRANNGLLLSGALAYYTLLSIIPLFTLALVVSSHFYSKKELLSLIRGNMELVVVVPGLTETLLDHIGVFLNYRKVIGWVGIMVLLFFSSMAFSILENTMSVIFHHRTAIHRRHFLVSAFLPFLFVLLLVAGLFLITLMAGAMQTMEWNTVTLFAWTFKLKGITSIILYLLGVAGLVILFSAIYLLMPTGNISVRHALLGGISATILWEIARHILIWYFSTLSFVNVVYGSLATSIVTLLTLEVAAMILLLGAQVIATYERIGAAGGPYKSGMHSL